LTELARYTGLDTSVDADKDKMSRAVTMIGQAVCTWEGAPWWFQHAEASFATVADQAEYNLRLVDADGTETGTKVAPDLWALTAVYYDDDWRLTQIAKERYEKLQTIDTTTSSSKPTHYAIWGEPPVIGFWPTPSSAYTMNLKYIKRHSKIWLYDPDGSEAVSADSDLIIPAEYQWDFYILSAGWLIQHERADIASLRQCPPFMAAIQRMAASAPTKYDQWTEDGQFPDAKGTYPTDRRVWNIDGGMFIIDNPTL